MSEVSFVSQVAIDFFAPRGAGACPVKRLKRATMSSRFFLSIDGLTPVETTIFATRGACIGLLYLKSPFMARNVLLVFVVAVVITVLDWFLALDGDALPRVFRAALYPHTRLLTGLRVNEHDVRCVDGHHLINDLPRSVALICATVFLHHVHPLDNHQIFLGQYAKNSPRAPAVLSGDYNNFVSFF